MNSFKIGDFVKLKSREWFERHIGLGWEVGVGKQVVISSSMAEFGGKCCEITNVYHGGAYTLQGCGSWYFTKEMFESIPKSQLDDIIKRCQLTGNSNKAISVKLIRKTKLLTDIKID